MMRGDDALALLVAAFFTGYWARAKKWPWRTQLLFFLTASVLYVLFGRLLTLLTK